MRAMTEIEWLDGRVTKMPELALGDALGESVQAELDFGFDDASAEPFFLFPDMPSSDLPGPAGPALRVSGSHIHPYMCG